MRIHSVSVALPEHHYEQERLLEAFRTHWADHYQNPARIDDFFRSVQVGGRHLALPLEEYEALDGFGERNAAWTRVASELGTRAVGELLERSGLEPAGVDLIVFTTVTGVAVPSIDARIVNRLRLGSHVKRMPLFGLGCLAGAAGIARAADYLLGRPTETAVLLSVELCSLTIQKQDVSIPNILSSGLFGDGSAAVLLTGSAHPLSATGGPRIVDWASAFFHDTERVMGWDVVDTGFKIVLAPTVPKMVELHLARETAAFLEPHGLTVADIDHFICHPGGPKVLEAIEQAYDRPREDFEASWRTLDELGNMSSSSVLVVLADILDKRRPRPGERGLLMAMGPGFCAELVLLQW